MKHMQRKIGLALVALFAILFYPNTGSGADSLQFPISNYLQRKGANYFGRKDYVTLGKWHLGDDINAKAGDEIYSIGAGIVRHAAYHAPRWVNGEYIPNYGGMYIIEHNVNGEKVCALYVHMNIATFTKSVGQVVTRGEYLGQVGNQQQNGGYPEHFHHGIRKGEYPADPNAYVYGDWIFSGYTANATVLDSWYNPTVFINSHPVIYTYSVGSYSDGFHADGTSQAFIDAFNENSPRIGQPVNNVHKWTGSDPKYRVWLQDFQGDMGTAHFGTDGQTALIYNNINDGFRQPGAYLVKEGMWDYYRNNNGPAKFGEPFTSLSCHPRAGGDPETMDTNIDSLAILA